VSEIYLILCVYVILIFGHRKGNVYFFIDSSFKLWDCIRDLAIEIWGVDHVIETRPKCKELGNVLILAHE
jgi:hypothetical protein